ncbi:MAG: hypothetical protein AAGJ52_06880 [Pseudomonadota bacterium]
MTLVIAILVSGQSLAEAVDVPEKSGTQGGAPEYTLRRSTIDNGGNRVTGAVYTLTATIGQYDAAFPRIGGSYQLRPGFWVSGESLPPGDVIFVDRFEGRP